MFVIAALTACGGGGGLAGRNNQSSDPGTVEYPIAYIQRPAPTVPPPANTPPNDLTNPFAFNPGAKLLVRSRADTNAREINITDALVSVGEEDLYDVKDLAVSPDGKNLVFAFHKPMLRNAQPIDQPTWDIYSYNFATGVVQAVIASKNIAEGNDVAPHFLADGRIVFVSDRQHVSKQKLIDSGSPGYSGRAENSDVKAGVLHVMNANGSNIDQISFNQSHDLSPSQLRNGKLVFSRWDNMDGDDRMDLYTLNPSGMNLSFLYGYNSHHTSNDPATNEQFSQPREMEDGRLAAIMRPNTARSMGGDLVAIDIEHFSDNAQPTWENSIQTGTAQTSLAANPVHTDGTLSPGGEFGSAWPLFDGTGRLLISWSQCRYIDSTDTNNTIRACTSNMPGTAIAAPLLYGIWIFDPKAQTQKPVVTPKEGVIYTDVVAASPAKTIAEIEDNSAANSNNSAEQNDLYDYGNNIQTILATNDTAVLDIRSVYNLDGGVGNFGAAVPNGMIANQANPADTAYQTRRARFLQIVQGVPLPDPDDEIAAGNNQILRVQNFAFGIGQNYLRHIVGYVPIEADGSVVVQVPANVPITFNILDANAQNIGEKHTVWWQFKTGEVVHCTGCHSTANSNASLTHGRFDSRAPDANTGTTSTGYLSGVASSSVNFAAKRLGQTMAEVYAGNNQKPRTPSLNVYFSDEWARNLSQQNPIVDYRYITNDPARQRQVPVPPVTSEGCLENIQTPQISRWTTSCRIVINYLEHIQPIWDTQSRLFNTNDGTAFAEDRKCTNCHSPADASGVARVPMGQLDLTNSASDRDDKRVMSFSELFAVDTQQQLQGGAVVDIPPDIVGQPNGTVITTEHTVAPVMNAGSAIGSARFFGCFNGGVCGKSGETGIDHSGMLTKSELRLLSEWLDNGAQYYNDVSKAAAAQ